MDIGPAKKAAATPPPRKRGKCENVIIPFGWKAPDGTMRQRDRLVQRPVAFDPPLTPITLCDGNKE